MFQSMEWADEAHTAIRAIRPDGTAKLIDRASRDLWEIATAGRLGTVEAYKPPPPPPVERVLAELQAGISAHVNRVARGRGYDDGVSCASYAASTVPLWAAEAAAFIAWRDAVWSAVLDGLESVQSGKTPMPVLQDIIAALPVIEWPEGYSE